MNSTTTSNGAYNEHLWSGGFNVASVDLIAMVVSDAGLASTEPQWWNASPLGCVFLGAQPRGGWQVLQRATQWGTDQAARCFGVDCKRPVLYAYFACSIRNRIEVWRSDNFLSPMVDYSMEPHGIAIPAADAPTVNGQQLSTDTKKSDIAAVPAPDELKSSTEKPPVVDTVEITESKEPTTQTQELNREVSRATSRKSVASTSGWKTIDRGVRGVFSVQRPTKLLDGSRGGQAFMCQILCPSTGNAYGVDEQARMQFLSILLVTAGLTHSDDITEFQQLLDQDFSVGPHLGGVFTRLLPGVLAVNALVIGWCISIFYALWVSNIYGRGAPYVIQLCSLLSWSSGATGLLMMGGNPRVSIDARQPVPAHVQDRLDALAADYTELQFGSLHGSVYVPDRGSCVVPTALLHAICRWKLVPVRPWSWWISMVWFAMFLLIGMTLQIAGTRVATVKSQSMSVVLLITTSLLRGIGLAGPEEWMIPRWKRRKDAEYAVALQGNIQSRASQAGV